MVSARPASLVFTQKSTDIQFIHDLIDDAHRMDRRNIFIQTAWKKNTLVLIIRFKLYICHRYAVDCYLVMQNKYTKSLQHDKGFLVDFQ